MTITNFKKPHSDYFRVMTASPNVAVGDVNTNKANITGSYKLAVKEHVQLLALPELGLTGYTTADLFHNHQLLTNVLEALPKLAKLTKNGPAMILGAPLVFKGKLYNCGVIMAGGEIKGVVPKTFLPNYKEFYDKRWFTSGAGIKDESIDIKDLSVPFGIDLLFRAGETILGIEICEDGWAPITPSAHAALAGAEIIVNLSASNEVIGKTEYRRSIINNLSAQLVCAYVYASAGQGESEADVIYGGHQMMSELGHMAKERAPLMSQPDYLVHDIDRAYILHDRIVNTTFGEQASREQTTSTWRTVDIQTPKLTDNRLFRHVDPYPAVPQDPSALESRCDEILNNLATALARRVDHVNTKAIVLGLSGGLDSTLALLIGVRACRILGKDTSFIHTVTMPGPASSNRTQDNAYQLAIALGTTHKMISIADLADDALTAIGHTKKAEDTAYENTQARMRTLLLMNYANLVGGMVQGTGDMSENAIGWCTYNGDHMSMYNPNTNVPKTLVRHLVNWFADHHANKKVKALLRDILNTPISPELTGKGDLSQDTESIVGPYDLQHFFLNELIRRGSSANKIGYLATQAFGKKFTPEQIAKYLNLFLDRFTASQWKRDVMPNGPKIGTIALSPRGDLRMAPNTSPDWYK